MDKPDGNGDGIKRLPVPHIRIVFNQEHYQCVVDGSTPNLEFARYMLQTALELTNKQIAERDNPRITLGEPLPPLARFKG